MFVDDRLAQLAADERPIVQVLDATGAVARSHSYRQVVAAAHALGAELSTVASRTGELVVGMIMGNSPEFVLADLALIVAGAVEVPVPLAFSDEQAASLLEDVDVCLVDDAGRGRLAEWTAEAVLPDGCPLVTVTLPTDTTATDATDATTGDAANPASVPASPWRSDDAVCKVIHTSGTTSRPKGVRVRAAGLDALLVSLRRVMPPGAYARYLSLVPLSLLIEQVTAIYLVVGDGGTLLLLPPEAPLVGTSSFAAATVLPYIAAARPTAMVATPALAEELADAADKAAAAGAPIPQTLFGSAQPPLLSCGGAPVGITTLQRLDEHGIAVYEGYGLSENSSVVSWNVPGDRRLGTVGRPLDHVEVRLADDGELLVRSTSLFAGYTRPDPSSCVVDDDGWLHTGDLAEIEDSGHIRIVGRKKNVIITAAGRNVAPEWVEAHYAALPFVRAVAVVGDGLENMHGLFLVDPATEPAYAAEQIARHGATRLSDVERVTVASVVPGDDDLYRTYFTVTGRPRRDAVRAAIKAGYLPATPLPPPPVPSAHAAAANGHGQLETSQETT